MGSSRCVPTLLASAQVTSSQGGAQARPQHSQAPQPSSRCHTSHRLQLELSGFLRTHHVMNLAEHPITSTNAADASVAATSSSPALCPCGLRLCISVVDSFNLRLLLCAALRGPCRRSDRAGPPHTRSPNLALHPRALQEHV